jgi:hypothetical protein
VLGHLRVTNLMCTNEKNMIVCRATVVASTPDRILHIHSPQKPSPLEPHPHRTSPTQTAAANQPDIQWCFSHLCTTSKLWPEDGQARPKHVVAVAAINRITRQLRFWRTLLPSFNCHVKFWITLNYCWQSMSFQTEPRSSVDRFL